MQPQERRSESYPAPRYLEVEVCEPIQSTLTKQDFLFKLSTAVENQSRSNEKNLLITEAKHESESQPLLPAVQSIATELSVSPDQRSMTAKKLDLHVNQDIFTIVAQPMSGDASSNPQELVHGRVVETETGCVITLHAVRPRYLAATAALGIICIFILVLGIAQLLMLFGIASVSLIAICIPFLIALVYVNVHIFLHGFRKPPPALIELVRLQARGIEPRSSTRP